MRKIFTLLLIVRKSILNHIFSSVIAIMSFAFAAGLLMSVFSIRNQAYEAFIDSTFGYDAVVGASGSELLLALNTTYYIGSPTGDIPWSIYTKFKNDPDVQLAVPYVMGDSYKGFRIVGTTSDIYKKIGYKKDKEYKLKGKGRLFEPESREAIIGNYVTTETGLKIGSKFHPYHGLNGNADSEHEQEFKVVGIMDPTNTPADRVIWVPIDQYYRLGGHVLRGSGAEYRPGPTGKIPERYREVSAIMLKFKNPEAGINIKKKIKDEGINATLVWPVSKVVPELFGKLGWFRDILTIVIYIIVFISFCSVSAAIYNTIDSRRRELAVFRALGAGKSLLLKSVLLESLVITCVGTLIGFVIYGFIFAAASYAIRSQTGVVINILEFNSVLLVVPIVMIVLSIVAGIIPALKAYSTEVEKNLNPPL